MILSADGTWQWDDTNRSDLPIGSGDLVAGQSSYSFADDYLDILNIKIKDSSGNWVILPAKDQSESSLPFEDDLNVDGMPLYYDKIGDTIKIYPAPSASAVTLTGGIKVAFQRTASLFTFVSDTSADTQEPGLPSTHHDLLAYMASVVYCMKYKKDRVGLYEKKIDEKKKTLIKFYSRREKDRRKIITTKGILFR